MTKLSELQPMREMPENLIVVPTFLNGKLKDTVLPDYEKSFAGNSNFEFYDTNKEDARGSNVFILGGLNNILENSGFRMIVPTDNIYGKPFEMIKDKFYTDLNALDIRGKEPDYKKNNGIWQQAKNLIEEHEGRLNLPSRIQGFYFELDETEKGYGVRIIPAKNFRVLQDDRLNLPSGTKFNSLDDIGMINPLNEGEKGKHDWYSIDNSVSRVYLNRSGDLGSYYDYLASSNDDGRVVIVDAEGVAPKFSIENYKQDIEKAYKDKVNSAEEIRKNALEKLAKL